MRLVYATIPLFNEDGTATLVTYESDVEIEGEEPIVEQAYKRVQCEELHWSTNFVKDEKGDLIAETVVYLRRIDNNAVIWVHPSNLEYAVRDRRTIGEILRAYRNELIQLGILTTKLNQWFDKKIREKS